MYYASLTIVDVAKKMSTRYYLRRGTNNNPLKDWTQYRHKACLFRTVPEAVRHLPKDLDRKDELGNKILFKYRYNVIEADVEL
jgi:hypothetical protein